MEQFYDPRTAIIDFIQSQPASIQEDLNLQVLLLAIGEQNIGDLPSLSDPVIRYFSKSGYAGIGAVICGIPGMPER